MSCTISELSSSNVIYLYSYSIEDMYDHTSGMQARKACGGGITLVNEERFYSMLDGINSRNHQAINDKKKICTPPSAKTISVSLKSVSTSDALSKPADAPLKSVELEKVSVNQVLQNYKKTECTSRLAVHYNKGPKERSAVNNKKITGPAFKPTHVHDSSSGDSSVDTSREDLSDFTVSSQRHRNKRGFSSSGKRQKHASLLNNVIVNNAKLAGNQRNYELSPICVTLASGQPVIQSRFQFPPAPSVHWITNDLDPDNQTSSRSPRIDSSNSTNYYSIKQGQTAAYSHQNANFDVESPLDARHPLSENSKSGLHYLVHYANGQGTTRYDYSRDECPMCNPQIVHHDSSGDNSRETGSSFDSESSVFTDTADSDLTVSRESWIPDALSLCTPIPYGYFSHSPSHYCYYDNSTKPTIDHVQLPCFTFNFSSPPFAHSGNVFLDLTDSDVKIVVERLPPVSEMFSHPKNRRYYPHKPSEASSPTSSSSNPLVTSSSSTTGTTPLQASNYVNQPSCNQYYNSANCMYLLPDPIRSPRGRDVFDSLKTCLVPPSGIRTYQVTQPPIRGWRKLADPVHQGVPFTMLCYNVLCPKYATGTQYPYCPTWALNWDYRRRGILEELRMYNADIICLQELETLEYEEVFRVELEKWNYQAAFLPKSRSRTMMETDSKNVVDGCAIFWKENKFEKVYEFHHEFMHSCTSVSDNPAPVVLNRVMPKDNIALGIIFRIKEPGGSGPQELCVTNGHIHWDPEFSDVKLIQTLMWTSELHQHIATYLASSTSSTGGAGREVADFPVILCGDLNSLPDSGVVDYLMHGSVNCEHAEFRGFGRNYAFPEWTTLRAGTCKGDRLNHHFNFDRAYKANQGMKWSNYTYDFRGMIDYVFFSKNHLRLLGSLDMVEESWFQEEKIVGCPHVHNHSDHFALFVELELVSPSSFLTSVVKR